MPRNEIGYGDQRSLADDIMVLIDDGQIELQDIVVELGETFEFCRRQLNKMQADGLITIDKDSPNWIVTPREN